MKKLSAFLISLFLLFASLLWAQDPTSTFPYYYYNSSERSLSNYNLSGTSKVIDSDNERTITMYKSGSTYNILVLYNSGHVPAEAKIKETLKENKDVAASLDSRLDNKMNTDMSINIIFADSQHNLICSAKYSENY